MELSHSRKYSYLLLSTFVDARLAAITASSLLESFKFLGVAAPLQPQEAEEMWLVTKRTHKLLQMHN